MPHIPEVGGPAANEQLAAYYDELDRLTGLALAGRLREDEFRQEMEREVEAALLLLFLLAGGDTASPAAERALAEQRRLHRNSIDKLADDVYGGRYSAQREEEAAGKKGVAPQTAEEGREKLRNRLILWGTAAAGVYHQGQIHRPARVNDEGEVEEPRYMWQIGATEEHCVDCLTFNGQVLTASEWRRLPAPQDPGLACGGWRCDCSLVPVDEPSVGIENVVS